MDINELDELLGNGEGEATEKLRAMLTAGFDLEKHVTNAIKDRKFTITGDASHLSVKYILGQAAKIDEPRKYDFQSEDVNEEDFLRSIKGLLPNGLFGLGKDTGDINAVMAGTATATFNGSRDHKCYDCAKPLRLTLTGTHIHLDCESACENNGEFFVDIDFPTGVVVYGDWPDRFSEIRDEGYLDECDDGESINYIKGQRQRSEGFANQGIFHLSVGNTSPTWYYNEATDEILIGNENFDEDADEYVIPEGFKDMGYFCTDLWWVTMLDQSRYEEMLSKLPGDRSKGYYEKDVETATIKPGRYRFFSVPRDSDDDGYSRIYAKAQYLGPCGEIPKVKHVSEGKFALTPRQMVIQSAKRYPGMYSGQFEEVRFNVMDHIFNVIGNGIKSKGEFLAHISVPAGTEISDEMPPETAKKPKHMDGYVRAPYPNFKKQYSLIGDVPVDAIPTEWLEEMVWFYNTSRDFFLGDNVGHYSHAFPYCGRSGGLTVDSMTKTLEGRRKEGQTEEEFRAAVTKDYECEYNGDVADFLTRRWAKELARIITFITETLDILHKELTSRPTKC